jgi:hypothetical protein
MKIKYILIVNAILISIAGAFFSIFGLSQLFAGASTGVIIMATTLEIGKIVTTTALHTYWNKISKGLKIYLTISVVILMLITSAGIYGFLSSAYQKTADKLEINNNHINIITSKKNIFKENVDDNKKNIELKNKRILELNSLRTNQESRLDASTSWLKDKSRNDISLSNKEIQKLSNDIDNLNIKNSILADSINKYTTLALEMESNNSVASEVGPLKYIAQLTGVSMGKIVNILILLLIFVFDPLAIALILMTSKVFEIEKNIKEETKTEEIVINKKLELPINKEITNLVDSFSDSNNITETIADFETPTENIIKDNVISHKSTHTEVTPTEVISSEVTPTEVIPTEVTPIENITVIEPEIKNEKLKITLDDVRENRGYSVNVPQPKNNGIERIDSTSNFKNKGFFNRK